MSKFLIRQLDEFKARDNIIEYSQHEKARGIDLLVVVEKELQEIWKVLNLYNNKNIYNIDESALFWKIIPDITFSTRQTIRKKYDKAQITINLICNIVRIYKPELQFIEKTIVLYYFGQLLSVNTHNF